MNANFDMRQYIAQLTHNDAPVWLISRDGLDHGPYTTAELIEEILNCEALPQHDLEDMRSRTRQPLAHWEAFHPLLQEQQVRLTEKSRRKAIANAADHEKRSGQLKLVIGVLALLAMLIIAAIFFVSRKNAKDELEAAGEGDLYAANELKLEGSAGILPAGRKGGRRRGKRGGGSGGGSFSGSYEAAMNQAMEMGDATRGGGEKQLSAQEVANVMNKHLQKLYRGCVVPEKSKGLSGTVAIDIAIAGSGKVLGASARSGSASFKKCIASKVKGVKFPSFSAPRMGARYNLPTG